MSGAERRREGTLATPGAVRGEMEVSGGERRSIFGEGFGGFDPASF